MDLRLSGITRRAENGRYPTISVNNDGTVVEMHQRGWANLYLYYSVGFLDSKASNDINWGPDISLNDRGDHPRISINDNGDVVEVHQSEGPRRSMWYRVGKVDATTKTIDWALGKSKYAGAAGRYTAVALSNEGKVVIVYQRAYFGTQTYYRIGNLNSEDHSITFICDSAQLFNVRDSVSELSLAINGEGILIAAGRGSGHNLLYKVGQLIVTNKGKSEITWQNERSADMDSNYPSVALDNEGHVISVQQSKRFRRITYIVGKIEFEGNKLNLRVTWSCDKKEYKHGCVPVIAISNDGQRIVEEHEENYRRKLFYCIGNLN